MNWDSFPKELQLMMLEWLSESSPHRLREYACVNSDWQLFFEAKTFQHLILDFSDVPEFSRLVNPRRQQYVCHILFLVQAPILECNDNFTPWFDRKGQEVIESQIAFSLSLRDLMGVLRNWETKEAGNRKGLALELGAVVTSKTATHSQESGTESKQHSQDPRLRRLQSSQEYDSYAIHGPMLREPANVRYASWCQENRNVLHLYPIDLQFPKFLGLEWPKLPEVKVVTAFIVRLEFYRNFGPVTIGIIMHSFPQLRQVRYERWRFAHNGSDYNWDESTQFLVAPAEVDSVVLTGLPTSVRTLSLFEESNTAYHQRLDAQASYRLTDSPLAKCMVKASVKCRHVSLAFIVSGDKFLEEFWPTSNPMTMSQGVSPSWKILQTIALTCSTLLSGSDTTVEELLLAAAAAAKNMPRLKIMELWTRDLQNAAFFRYDSDDCRTQVAWGGIPQWRARDAVLKAWGEVADQRRRHRHVLQVSADEVMCKTKGCIIRHLKLQKLILPEDSLYQAEIFRPSAERLLYGKRARLAKTMSWACKNGDSEVIRACVAHGASSSYVRAVESDLPIGYAMRRRGISYEERRIYTLVLAAQKHHDEAFETLVKIGARLEGMTRRDQRYLTRNLKEEENWRKTRCLLNAGMGHEFIRYPHKCLQSYVEAGAPVDILRHLLDLGAQVDLVVAAPDKPSKTPLSTAIELDQPEVVEFLLESGANVHQPKGAMSRPQRRLLAYRSYEHIPILAAARAMARTGSTQMMKLCLRFGADINYAFNNRPKPAPAPIQVSPREHDEADEEFNQTPLLEYAIAIQKLPPDLQAKRRSGLEYFFDRGVKFQVPDMDSTRWAPIPPHNRRTALKLLVSVEHVLGSCGLKFVRKSIYFQAIAYVVERRLSLVKT
ncbi:hypothetical protein HJFPF1_11868 [Paramyrothecium foliicola]|nr:hypothetical protein HJFPF1_11868 [Paramyrothecium foliicola]